LNRFAGLPVTWTGTTLALPVSSACTALTDTVRTGSMANAITAASLRPTMEEPPPEYVLNNVDHEGGGTPGPAESVTYSEAATGGEAYVANSCDSSRNALNSSALPAGSRKNIVHCSPGSPANLR